MPKRLNDHVLYLIGNDSQVTMEIKVVLSKNVRLLNKMIVCNEV